MTLFMLIDVQFLSTPDANFHPFPKNVMNRRESFQDPCVQKLAHLGRLTAF